MLPSPNPRQALLRCHFSSLVTYYIHLRLQFLDPEAPVVSSEAWLTTFCKQPRSFSVTGQTQMHCDIGMPSLQQSLVNGLRLLTMWGGTGKDPRRWARPTESGGAQSLPWTLRFHFNNLLRTALPNPGAERAEDIKSQTVA